MNKKIILLTLLIPNISATSPQQKIIETVKTAINKINKTSFAIGALAATCIIQYLYYKEKVNSEVQERNDAIKKLKDEVIQTHRSAKLTGILVIHDLRDIIFQALNDDSDSESFDDMNPETNKIVSATLEKVKKRLDAEKIIEKLTKELGELKTPRVGTPRRKSV